jgi:hypothetical protein
MAVPLAEAGELNDPQVAALLPGVQLQVTPPFAESLATVAVMDSVPLATREVGAGVGTVLSVTVMGGGAVALMVIAGVLALIAVLVSEVAVMTTVRAGTVAGAVYVTAVPLAEAGELNVPQEPAGAQLQVTPWFAESLATVAVTGIVPFAYRDVGVVLSLTVMKSGGGGVEKPPPHAASVAIMLRLKRKRIDLRKVIVHLPRFEAGMFFGFGHAAREGSAPAEERHVHFAP